MKGFGDPGRRTWASDHERARQRAAERLSLPLPAAEAAWLDAHLGACPACARVAEQYGAHQDRLRRLRPIDPPRDLWARTSAALDRAERDMAGRALPTTAANQHGRRRMVRSIRSLRAEQHASALGRMRGAGRGRLGRGAPLGRNPRWAFPFATLGAFTIVVATAGLLLTGEPRGGLPGPPGTAGAPDGSGPGATPITINVAQVAWLSPNLSGGYNLNVASVDQVCPDEARHDCAPIEGTEERSLPSFANQPAAVVRSPSKSQLIVVDRSARTGGGSVYVVAMPSAIEPPATPVTEPPATPAPTTAATPEPTPEPTPAGTIEPTPEVTAEATADPAASIDPAPSETAPATAEPSGLSSPEPTMEPTPEPTAEPTPEPTLEPSAEPSPLLSPEPSIAATVAIINNVVLVGESAAYSADGSMFAFSARPADGSHGPDIYLWHVGEPQAHPVTVDHASIFSGWAGNLIIGSRAAFAPGVTLETQVPDPGQGGGPSLETPVPDPGQDGGPSPEVSPSDAALGGAAQGFTAEAQAALASDGVAEIGGARALLAPLLATPSDAASPERSPEPSAAPSASAADPPATAPGDAVAPEATPPGTPAPGALDSAVPVSFLVDPATGLESVLASTPAWRPVVDPTGRFVVFWSGTLRYDAASLAWWPDAGRLYLAPWQAFSSAGAVEVPAVPLFEGEADLAPAGEWDARWDDVGDHLAVWAADPGDPAIGRLNLLAVDSSASTLSSPLVLLRDEPALPGISIGQGRLVWATPPGQDGEGSRIQVLAWSGEHAGQIVSEPASGDDAIIVVR